MCIPTGNYSINCFSDVLVAAAHSSSNKWYEIMLQLQFKFKFVFILEKHKIRTELSSYLLSLLVLSS